MKLPRPFALVSIAVVLVATLGACASEDSETEATGASSSALSGYSRQSVYAEEKSHAKAAKDLLSSSTTDPRLVSAIGWLHDNAPSITISAIRTDHHNDGPGLHAGGFCADLYANDSSQMKQLVELANKNPWVAEIGLGGSYKSYKSSVTKKAYFDDNGQTHVHIGVKKSAGQCKSGSCDAEASVAAANNTAPSAAAVSAPDDDSDTTTNPTSSSSTSATASNPTPATGDDDDDDASGAPTPDPATDPAATCASFTLQQSVVPGTCVQRADDSEWYVCDGTDLGAWPVVSGPLDPQCEVCPQLDDGQCAESI